MRGLIKSSRSLLSRLLEEYSAGMKRLLILSVFLSGGLVQMPTSASSHNTSWCYELWEEASRDGIDAIDKIQLVDMDCSKFLSPDNTRWVDSKPQQPSSSADTTSSNSNPMIWCAMHTLQDNTPPKPI